MRLRIIIVVIGKYKLKLSLSILISPGKFPTHLNKSKPDKTINPIKINKKPILIISFPTVSISITVHHLD